MSVFGTGVAAGVAQSGLQSQQVARKRDSSASRTSDQVKRVRELFDTRLRALEEGDEADTPARLHIDGQLPEHQQDKENRRRQTGDTESGSPDVSQERADNAASAEDGAPSAADDAPNSPLYRHVDLEA